jgi:hypothetical protein
MKAYERVSFLEKDPYVHFAEYSGHQGATESLLLENLATSCDGLPE